MTNAGRVCSLMRSAWVAVMVVGVSQAGAQTSTFQGAVQTNQTGLPGYRVSLYAAFNKGSQPVWQRLGSATSDAGGRFRIGYTAPGSDQGQAVLFVEAEKGSAMLATAIGAAESPPASVVVNERTTVAAGASYAQFVHGSAIQGNTVGITNAAHVAADLANPVSGGVGEILGRTPNGSDTTTLATFNTLANAVAACVAESRNCQRLFKAVAAAGGGTPGNVLEAVAQLTKNPSFVARDGTLAKHDPLFDLAKSQSVYSPALPAAPTNWLLFLKFTGGFYSVQDSDNLMNGPANFAIDARGYAWIGQNYVPQPPDHFACAGNRLVELTPWGTNVSGSPFTGGGLSGSGYGITFDPRGNLWTANFGFQDPPCTKLPQAAPSDSVSLFSPDGKALSPPSGITQGGISWPQGVVSDRHGTIWVASCGNDSVTRIPDGNPDAAVNIPLGPKPSAGDPQIKPFGLVVDSQGNVWASNNRSNTVSVLSSSGQLLATLPGTYRGRTMLSHPVGNAVDTKGNVWIANSDWLDVPCPTRRDLGTGQHPSIALYDMKTRKPYRGSPFTGGGLTLPWGITVDGADTVWVFNFGPVPVGQPITTPTGISRFCGATISKCPSGRRVGQPISPNTGYRSDALIRITGGQIDPSGNIWMTGNWKLNADPFKNPGGNSFVIAIGAAAPIKTPLRGPPVPVD